MQIKALNAFYLSRVTGYRVYLNVSPNTITVGNYYSLGYPRLLTSVEFHITRVKQFHLWYASRHINVAKQIVGRCIHTHTSIKLIFLYSILLRLPVSLREG